MERSIMSTVTKKANTGYDVDGQVVGSLKEVAELLGVARVTRKQLEEEYADVVTLVELSDDEWEETTNRVVTEDDEEDTEVDKDSVYSALSDDVVDITPEEVKESMPEFTELDELKEFIKDLDTPTLEYLAKGLGLTWKPTYHANIHRMRVAMEMQRYFFPELFVPKDNKKKKAKYGDLSTEELFSKADELKLDYKKSGNEAIDRMRVIMTLKDAGHLAE